MKNSKYIRNSIIWSQLISICEEQANVLLKVAFGALVREAGDISAGIFNNKGKMLAQAVTGTPGHVNTMAEAVPKFLKIIPMASIIYRKSLWIILLYKALYINLVIML